MISLFAWGISNSVTISKVLWIVTWSSHQMEKKRGFEGRGGWKYWPFFFTSAFVIYHHFLYLTNSIQRMKHRPKLGFFIWELLIMPEQIITIYKTNCVTRSISFALHFFFFSRLQNKSFWFLSLLNVNLITDKQITNVALATTTTTLIPSSFIVSAIKAVKKLKTVVTFTGR